VASLLHVLAFKLALDRKKDRADVEVLRRVVAGR
jgi:hypothetical protein